MEFSIKIKFKGHVLEWNMSPISKCLKKEPIKENKHEEAESGGWTSYERNDSVYNPNKDENRYMSGLVETNFK